MEIKKVFIFFFSLIFFATCTQNEEAKVENIGEERLKPQFPFKGRIVFQSNFDGDSEIYLMTKRGIKKLTDNTWNDEYPVWSPDGKKIAFSANPDGNYDIFIMNADGTGITPVVTSPTDEKNPAWFPDGKSIAYTRGKKGLLRKARVLYRVNLETEKTEKILPQFSRANVVPHISPVASLMTFTGKRTMGWDVAVCNMETTDVKFLDEGGKSCRARFSKNGQRLVYVSSKADGKGDIWLMRPDGSGKTRLTKMDDTYEYFPSWSPDGKYIVFNSSQHVEHDSDWKLYILKLKTQEVFYLFDSPGNDIFPDWY